MTNLTQQTMTIKELAEVAGCDHKTVRRTIEELYPGLMKNGIKTELNYNQSELVMHNLRIKGGLQSVPRQNAEVTNNPLEVAKIQLESMLKMITAIQETQAKQKEHDSRIEQLENKIEKRLTDDVSLQLVLPSQLGKMFEPNLTAQKVNIKLREAGLQWKVGGEWIPTNEGRPYSSSEPVQVEAGKIVYQLKWQRKVKELLV
jgi:hypothetical protein